MFSKSDNENPILNNYGLTKLPPGQLFTDKFPVLTYGATPSIILDNWKFEVSGLVNEKLEWNWDEFKQLPMQNLIADFHCVTHWSRFDDVWSGVMFKDFWDIIKENVNPKAKYVMQHAYGGYTTNLPIQQMIDEDVMLALKVNDVSLESQHGGPLRVFTPKRYAWKGAKMGKRI